tara:strand:+ start:580 stop:1005 length:426 start_codon:yes stop_codon:yes gene_type:complete
MKNNYKFYILLLINIISFEQLFSQNALKLTENSWLFKSMTTITKAKREKISILYQDENNFETLTFRSPDILEYYIINDGIEHNGLAKWSLINKNLTIISGRETTESFIEIDGSFLSIITKDYDPLTNYTFTTIIKYEKKVD